MKLKKKKFPDFDVSEFDKSRNECFFKNRKTMSPKKKKFFIRNFPILSVPAIQPSGLFLPKIRVKFPGKTRVRGFGKSVPGK